MFKFPSLAVTAALIAGGAVSHAQSFVLDQQAAVTGSYELIGNVAVDTTTVQVGNNGNFYKVLDADGMGATTQSTGAELTLPPGASVVSATVYLTVLGEDLSWQNGVTDPPIQFGAGPAAAVGYTTSTPRDFERFTYSSVYGGYQAVYDVTTQVSGDGVYWVGETVLPNLGVVRGITANWALLVMYQVPGAPTQSVFAYRSNATLCFRETQPNLTLTGFQTPPNPPINARLSIVASDGNAGPSGAQLNLPPDETVSVGGPTNYLANASNPLVAAPPYYAKDIGNSTVSRVDGTPFAIFPSTFNQITERLDLDTFNASAFFAVGDTTKTVATRCMEDGIFFHAMVIAFDTLAPTVTVQKGVEGNDPLLLADTVTYTIATTVAAASPVAGTDLIVTDTIPTGLDYIAGSLELSLDNSSWSPLTDAVDLDAGSVTGQDVAVAVGNLAIGATVWIRLSATVDVAPSTFSNTASASFVVSGETRASVNSNEVVITSAAGCFPSDQTCERIAVYGSVTSTTGALGTIRCFTTAGGIACDTEADAVTLTVYDGLYCPGQP